MLENTKIAVGKIDKAYDLNFMCLFVCLKDFHPTAKI